MHHPARRAAQVVVPLGAQARHGADGGAGPALREESQCFHAGRTRRQPGRRITEDHAAASDRVEARRHVLDARVPIHQHQRPVRAHDHRAVQAPRLQAFRDGARREHLVEHRGAADAAAPHGIAPHPARGDRGRFRSAQSTAAAFDLHRNARLRGGHQRRHRSRRVGEHDHALHARCACHAFHGAREHGATAEFAIEVTVDAGTAVLRVGHHHRHDPARAARCRHLHLHARQVRAARKRERFADHRVAPEHFADGHFHRFGHHARARIDDAQPGLAVRAHERAHAAHGGVVEFAALHSQAPFQGRERQERVELRAPRGIKRRSARMPHAVHAQRVDAHERHRVAADVPQQPMRAFLRTPGAERAEFRGITATLAGQADRALPPSHGGALQHCRHHERGSGEELRGQLPEDRLQVRFLHAKHHGIGRYACTDERPKRARRARQHVLPARFRIRQRTERKLERRSLRRQDPQHLRAGAGELGNAGKRRGGGKARHAS